MNFKTKLTLGSLPFSIAEIWWAFDSGGDSMGGFVLGIWVMVYLTIWAAELSPGRHR